MAPEVAPLFEPITHRGWTLPSRVLLAPINTGFAEKGLPTDKMSAFHAARSGPHIGISMVGNVAVAEGAANNSGTAVLADPDAVPSFGAVAGAIRHRGSLAGIQLAHSGFLAPTRGWRADDPQSAMNQLRTTLLSFPARSLDEHLSGFVVAAALAVRSGFEVIQIHGAHGYLLSLLLSRELNRRTDRFRALGPATTDLFRRLRDVVSTRLLSVRINVRNGPVALPEEAQYVADLAAFLDLSGVDILEVSAGLYSVDRRLIYPTSRSKDMPYLAEAIRLSSRFSSLVSVAGNLRDLRDIPTSAPSRMLFAVGRAFIADADFATKARAGHHEAIVRCQRSSQCHYFSRGRAHIACGVNPEWGSEENLE
jgi:2,4-dienoyl-CoA reductase-like NADH-dependent reductase (Old Yellow Enzyme family)